MARSAPCQFLIEAVIFPQNYAADFFKTQTYQHYTGKDMPLTHRDQQIICGLYLSKYDQEGLDHLGFSSFAEAFNTLGFLLNARPASLKNYRDELDPFFPNQRQGWHKRPLRAHCKYVMEEYANLAMSELGDVIRGFLPRDQRLDQLPDLSAILQQELEGPNSAFAKRLITGEAAEAYFRARFREMSEFASYSIKDTTTWGCGFDFKATQSESANYLAIEVKGLRSHSGQIQLTDLEYRVADKLESRYYLVLVRNFSDEPYHTVISNPLRSDLQFTPKEQREVRKAWVANVKT